MKVSGKEIVKEVSKDTKTTNSFVENIIQATFKAIEGRLKNNDKVVFVNFGSFETRVNKAGMRRNPMTGEPVYKEESKRPHFRAFDAFKDAINKKE